MYYRIIKIIFMMIIMILNKN